MSIKIKNIDYQKKAREVIRTRAFINEEILSEKQIYNKYYNQYRLFKSKFPDMSESQLEREVYFNLLSDENIQVKAKILGDYHSALVYNLEEQFSAMASTYPEIREILNWFANKDITYNEFLELVKAFKDDPNGAYMKKERYR